MYRIYFFNTNNREFLSCREISSSRTLMSRAIFAIRPFIELLPGHADGIGIFSCDACPIKLADRLDCLLKPFDHCFRALAVRASSHRSRKEVGSRPFQNIQPLCNSATTGEQMIEEAIKSGLALIPGLTAIGYMPHYA
jgi:hypothetical protein